MRNPIGCLLSCGRMSRDRRGLEPGRPHRGSRHLTRRQWLAGAAALVGSACAPGRHRPGAGGLRSIETATGRIPADRLGVALMHEHVLVDFAGAEFVGRHRYDSDHVVETVLPHLRRLRALGCNALVECTPAYLGRDAALLKRLSDAAGIHILSNTGYYGAANDKHLPRHAFTETAEQLAGTGAGKAFCSGGDVFEIIEPLLDRDVKGHLEFTRMTASSRLISPSSAMSTAIRTAAWGVRLPSRVCSIHSLPFSMVNSTSWTSL